MAKQRFKSYRRQIHKPSDSADRRAAIQYASGNALVLRTRDDAGLSHLLPAALFSFRPGLSELLALLRRREQVEIQAIEESRLLTWGKTGEPEHEILDAYF